MAPVGGTLLSAVAVTGAGTTIVFPFMIKDIAIQFSGAGTTFTAIVVDVEGSLDGVTWFVLATKTFTAGELTAKAALHVVENAMVSHIRLNPTTVTVTAATLSAICKAEGPVG